MTLVLQTHDPGLAPVAGDLVAGETVCAACWTRSIQALEM